MKRKIAAIMAADIAGYSRLVAEDEEETLRRLAAYRSVFEDFVARASGRIFNTAGDAVLSEFPSAVEAVRCAIDIQESLRTRNLAYPPSRQMNFRIGITVGDVVERDGDLLGDGVNIAARLEGLAEPGGICVSRSVYEQVANKLSVQFADIGEQQVKNIPTAIHAYIVAMAQSHELAGGKKTKARFAARGGDAGRGCGARRRGRHLLDSCADTRTGSRDREHADGCECRPRRAERSAGRGECTISNAAATTDSARNHRRSARNRARQ